MPDLVIEASRLGLPETASVEELATAIYAQRDEVVVLKAEVERWKDRAEENQRALLEARKDQKDKKKLEGQLLIAEARAAKKIFKADEKFYLELYDANPELCKKRLGELREMRYLENQESLRGPIGDAPADAQAEFNVLVAQELANNKDMSEGDAVKAVQRKHPQLSQQVFDALVAESTKGRGAGKERD